MFFLLLFLIEQFKSFPMSLSYGYNQLWTGHKSGQLKVTYPNDGLFDVVKVSSLNPHLSVTASATGLVTQWKKGGGV